MMNYYLNCYTIFVLHKSNRPTQSIVLLDKIIYKIETKASKQQMLKPKPVISPKFLKLPIRQFEVTKLFQRLKEHETLFPKLDLLAPFKTHH